MRLPNLNMTIATTPRLQRIAMITAIVLMVRSLAGFCWVIWLERYVVYSRDLSLIHI